MANGALGLRKRDLAMVNLPRVYLPAARTMAGVAIIGGRNVIEGFPRSHDAIVAGETAGNYAGMVEQHRSPGGRRVTIAALVAGREMLRRFALGLLTIVTGNTRCGGEKMTEASNAESPGVVALVAIECIVQMNSWFTWSEDAIVTDLAARRRTAINLIAVAVGAEDLAVTALQREAC